MKPALSIVFFTVSSGAGLGLFALLVLADLAQAGGGLSQVQLLGGGALALGLVAAGLLASTLHLANPKNAWRAFARIRTSWLSREALFAVLFGLAALAYLAGVAAGSASLRIGAGLVSVPLAWAVLYCTAMIYASLKPIRQWHTRLTPLCYLLFGHFSGGLLLAWVAGLGDTRTGPYLIAAAVLLLLSAAAKLAWYANAAADAGQGMQEALGLRTAASVKLLDAGHTHANFITDEFAFRLARGHAGRLRAAFWLLACALPALALAFFPEAVPGAALCCLAGLLAERWLFFAEARHVVNLYLGARRA